MSALDMWRTDPAWAQVVLQGDSATPTLDQFLRRMEIPSGESNAYTPLFKSQISSNSFLLKKGETIDPIFKEESVYVMPREKFQGS